MKTLCKVPRKACALVSHVFSTREKNVLRDENCRLKKQIQILRERNAKLSQEIKTLSLGQNFLGEVYLVMWDVLPSACKQITKTLLAGTRVIRYEQTTNGCMEDYDNNIPVVLASNPNGPWMEVPSSHLKLIWKERV